MNYKDYYAILGVQRTATAAEIKQAYRKLARKYHPDVSKEPQAEERFKAVQEAYEVLKDEQKRATYDQFGANWQGGQEFKPPPGGGFEHIFTGSGGGAGFSDFFEMLFGERQDAFSSGKAHRNHRTPRKKSPSQKAEITISLEEAYHGVTKLITLTAPASGLSGAAAQQRTSLRVNIPPGTVAGQQLRLNSQEQSHYGNLLLCINIAPHQFFTVKNRDVYVELPITPWEAALGGKVLVPTLAGTVEVKLGAQAQSGNKLRLKGRGLPCDKSGSVTGDQYVVLQIVNPPNLNSAQLNLYTALAQASNFNPRTKFGIT